MGDALLRAHATENTGSLARDHLANERTYLAWLRTGMAATALGVAAPGLSVLGRGAARTITVLFIAIGLAALIYGTCRFYRVQRDLAEGIITIGSRGPFVLAAACVGVALLAGALMFS